MSLQHIPAELRECQQWVGWRQEQRGGKPTKVPVNSRTGALAKSNDPATWSSYDEALSAVERYGCNGVGFVFAADDPYAGVDLDDCFNRDGTLGRAAREIVDTLDTYTELSPSRRGLHCILRGRVPDGARKQAVLDGQSIEVYCQARFFCMTGDTTTDGTPIGDAQPQFEALCGQLKAAARARGNGGPKLREGEGRNNELTRRLGFEVGKGVTGAELTRRAHELNDFEPPLTEVEVEKVLRSAEQWAPGEGDPLVHEAAHTEVLKNEWLGLYRWSQHEESWRHWTRRVWKQVAEPVVVAAAQKALRRHYGRCLAADQRDAEYKRLHALHIAACRYASVLAGLAFLKGEPGFHTTFEEWDADPYKLNCADGLLDVRTQTLGPHDPEALCTRITR